MNSMKPGYAQCFLYAKSAITLSNDIKERIMVRVGVL